MSARRRVPAPLDHEAAAKIKGMLARGDQIDDVSVWFGVNAHLVRAMQSGSLHVSVEPAPGWALPPPGPYDHAVRAYQALREVREAEQLLNDMALAAPYEWGAADKHDHDLDERAAQRARSRRSVSELREDSET